MKLNKTVGGEITSFPPNLKIETVEQPINASIEFLKLFAVVSVLIFIAMILTS